MSKKIICIVAIISICFSASAFAQGEEGMKRIFRDTGYGGLIGAVAGAAFMLFTDKPEDHFDYIATGAGIGILGGLAYGVANSTGYISLAEVEDGKVILNIPDIDIKIVKDKGVDAKEIVGTVNLLAYKF